MLLTLLAAVSLATDDIQAAVVIGTMVVLSTVLRFWQEAKSNKAADALKDMVSNTATVMRRDFSADASPVFGKFSGASRQIRGAQRIELPIKQLVPGDLIVLSAGDMIPADCRVLSAKDLFVSQAAMTGESMPVEKFARQLDSQTSNPLELDTILFMGTNVVSGAATAVVLTTGNNTYFGALAQRVGTTERGATSFQAGVNKVSWLLIRFMFVMAPLVLFINGFTKGDWTEALLFALSVAVGLTPEMLPMIVTSTLAKGAVFLSRKKVIVKRLDAIQNFGAMDVLCTDKTGTLTEGRPEFHSVEATPDFNPHDVLQLAASLDQGSEHPLAHAIVDHARTENIALTKPESFESGSGIGVSGLVDGKKVQLGNTALMDAAGVSTKVLQYRAELLRLEGISIIYLAVDGVLAGLLAVSDPIKPTSKEAVTKLKADNVKIIMATGDGLTTARAVAKEMGIEEVHGEVKPQDKERLVADLQRYGRKVAMAGDGINDAPALARADVGIAMGTGTDVAMNSAQLTLVKGDLMGILRARALSVATVKNMRQNLGFAFLYNSMGIPLAAGLLYPLTGHLLSPMIAALAMSVSSASVVFNALRLRNTHIA